MKGKAVKGPSIIIDRGEISEENMVRLPCTAIDYSVYFGLESRSPSRYNAYKVRGIKYEKGVYLVQETFDGWAGESPIGTEPSRVKILGIEPSRICIDAICSNRIAEVVKALQRSTRMPVVNLTGQEVLDELETAVY
jgi:hypothetical protein